MTKNQAAEIAETLTLTAMKSGKVDMSASSIGKYYAEVYREVSTALGQDGEIRFKWAASPLKE